jgi:hypothetical protein
MWSLTSPHTNRISGPKNFRSLVKKDFFNTIGQKQTHAPQQGDLFDHLVGAGKKGVRNLKAKRLGRLEIEIRSTARRL